MGQLRVIFVHGISPRVIQGDYATGFRTALVAELTRMGLLAPDAPAADVDRVIHFDEVNYSMLGQEAELQVLNAVVQQRQQIYSRGGRWASSGLDRMRRQIITAVSDVLIYKSDYWHHQICDLVVEKIRPALGSDDAVSLVGHSLGSVVAFDTIYFNRRYNEDWQALDFRPANLFTLGSPIALFSLDLDRETGSPRDRYTPGTITGADLIHPAGVWYNFLDSRDLIAYPLQALFAALFPVEDKVVTAGMNPRAAHSHYWRDSTVVRTVAERLRLDYARITGWAPPPLPAPAVDLAAEDAAAAAREALEHGEAPTGPAAGGAWAWDAGAGRVVPRDAARGAEEAERD